jgi:hypothetical protein
MAVNVKKGGTTIDPKSLVVNQVEIRSVDRTPKDIQDYVSAQRAAESVSHPLWRAMFDIYTKADEDGHITGIVEKRIAAVVNKEISFENKKTKEKVDALDDLIGSEEFRDVQKLIMQRIFWGVSGMEFIPGEKFKFKIVPRKHIKTHLRRITKNENGDEGTQYDERPNIWILHKEGEYGLYWKASFYAIYKRANWGDWAQYAEIFGMPVRVIEYDPEDEQAKIELDEILEESGSAMCIKIPRGCGFEMKDGKASNGDGQLFERMKDSLNAELSVLILGNTETTTNGKTGTGAKSEIHQEQQLEYTKDDLKYMVNMLNSDEFIAILKSYGYPVDGGHFVVKKEVDLKQVAAKLSIMKQVQELGEPIDADEIYETSGLRKPKDYEQQKAAKQALKDKLAQDPDDEENEPPAPQKKPKKAPEDLSDNTSLSEKVEAAVDRYLGMLKRFFQPAPATGRLMTSLRDYYSTFCPICGGVRDLSDTVGQDAFSSIVEDLAGQLYNKKLKDGHIPQHLYSKTADTLMKAMFEGMGEEPFGYDDPRNEMRAYMEHNIHAFSAAKSLAEVKHYRSLILDENGKERSATAYRNACTDAGFVFNKTYLETERVSVVATTQSAAAFAAFGDDDAIEISTVGDAAVREEHAQMDGFTALKKDPIWYKLCPPFDWNCRCKLVPGLISRLSQRDRGAMFKAANIPKYFQRNPALNREVFTDDHPYYSAAGGKLKEMTAEGNYGMQSIDHIYDHNEFPAAIESATKGEANSWWRDKAGDLRSPIDITDITGNTVRLTNDFRNHIFEDNREDRWRWAGNLPDILQKPDEVWSYKEKGQLKKAYLKFYDGYPVIVKVDGTDAATFFRFERDGKLNSASAAKHRRGALLYRK